MALGYGSSRAPSRHPSRVWRGPRSVEAHRVPVRFLRTHHAWIVNPDQAREAQPWSKGSWFLMTKRGLRIPVGPQPRDALGKTLG